ncbi:hypothetical protein [Legionella jordanis]|uniref:Uncharacterized protein n=1 Tax=Legionella jordanis TaxID=456 RepID=A0A0W0VA74_9GAMM|nr:hypothetical protein [Legionella jordanis]KTD16521.1 hypothetical protein Ljor_0827 [Legionella jordanis]RMX03936.1 hypothetical protein EAW55_06155 [Legionella jordanis]RMX21996.1 hypothetical protein EAS68_00255 [Legionella jordanis]VEH12018.1 Uncharacterised protein [Legionella jordanis]HAT8712679.1 hypothetical protein [Legionella jordanis]
MGRSITHFNGQAVVIGCSHFHSFCSTKHLHDDEENFYTIDANGSQNPDFEFNITHLLPEPFKNRFKLTLLECIDFTAYNDYPQQRRDAGVRGFQNTWDMTAEDGFIVIVGCPRYLEYRRQLSLRNLKYFELDSKAECILIPKNQNLSFQEVQQQMAKLEPSLKKTIDAAKTYGNATANNELGFCMLDYHSLPSIFRSSAERIRAGNTQNQEKIASVSSAKEAEKILAFQKIYLALYDGQSSFFKRKSPLLCKPDLSIADITAYIKLHPNGRSAMAWALARNSGDVNSSNENLFRAIHNYSFRHSSSFFGIFKQTKNFPDSHYQNIAAKIAHAPAHSRTGKIRDQLDESLRR